LRLILSIKIDRFKYIIKQSIIEKIVLIKELAMIKIQTNDALEELNTLGIANMRGTQ